MDLSNYVAPAKTEVRSPIALFKSFGFHVPKEKQIAVSEAFAGMEVGFMHIRFRPYAGFDSKQLAERRAEYMQAHDILIKAEAGQYAQARVLSAGLQIDKIIENLDMIERLAKEHGFGERIKKKPTSTMGDLLREAMAKQG